MDLAKAILALGLLQYIPAPERPSDLDPSVYQTSFDTICAAPAYHGLGDTIIRWIRAMLAGRQVKAASDQTAVKVAVRRGVDVSKVTPQTTLNEYLRDNLHLTGTKRMCLEGGCGACIVSVSRSNPVTGKPETFAVNSCLVSIFSCFGWSIYTVEGLSDSESIHSIQNILVKFNGTQCGYCTPGMVMNMYALQESLGDVTMNQVENAFGGNICRCTGYRPILSAFKSLCKDATPELLGQCPDIEDIKSCKDTCKKYCFMKIQSPFYFKLGKKSWIKVMEFTDLLQVVKSFHGCMTSYMLVAGNTGRGVYKIENEYDVYVDILNVTQLINYEITKDKVVLGANMSLTESMNLFYKISENNIGFKYLKKVADHIDLIANVPVRNAGTLAGNLMLKNKNKSFPSDIFLVLETIGAKLQIVDINNQEYVKTPADFLEINMSDKIIKKIIVPALKEHYYYESYKIMPRAQNAHALVNAGFLFKINDKLTVEDARIVYGCINPKFVHAVNTEKYLIGQNVFENKILQGAYKILNEELNPDFEPPEPEPVFRKNLATSLFYKYILSIAPINLISKKHRGGGDKLLRPVSSGTQDFETKESLYPLSEPISKIEAAHQTTGIAEYITDMPDLPDQLYAAFVLAKTAPNSKIVKINTDKAMKIEGVVAFFDKNDIPGRNSFIPKGTPWLQIDEEVFCSGVVKYHSQPVGMIVAKTHRTAEKAADLVEVTYSDGIEKPVFSVRDILKRNISNKITQDQIIEPKTKGTNIKHVVKGTFDLNWQYHFHMETQCCNVIPREDELDMYPGSQWMDLCQNAAATVLNIPTNKINVSVRRLGGAFGAKIVRSALVSSAAALAAHKLNKPVKLWMSLETNMRVIGKRNPLASDYEVATDDNGVIQSLNNTFYYDQGQGGNECLVFLLLDAYFGLYNSETWYTNSSTTNTDMHATCYIRAPGSIEGFSMVEAIMEHTAMSINMDPLEFRIMNMNKKHPALLKHIEELSKWADIDQRKSSVTKFNTENRWRKKGLSIVPMVFPFLACFSYDALVSIYHHDGNVVISHSGVEMGQGINTKAAQVCAYKLGISVDRISVKPSNNLVGPNSWMTGGSMASEAVCWAIMKACDELLARMKPIKEKMANPTWEGVVKKCFEEFISLSSTSLYSPNDPEIKNYDIYGVCCTEVELDVLTGQHQVCRVDLIEDVGDSMSPQIDIGQVEGAFVMGLGYFTTEQTIVGEKGEILTNRTWNYKPPGVKDIPIDFRVKFPKNNPNPVGVLKSKATGEPPICLAVSIPFAIRQAVASARQDAEKSAPKWYPINGPSTVENTFMNCLNDYKHFTL